MTTFSQLEILAKEIEAKAFSSPDSSYTAKLLSRGVDKCAKKLGEEAVELVIAAVEKNKAEVTKEAIPKADAEALKKQLEDAGAKVEVTPARFGHDH